MSTLLSCAILRMRSENAQGGGACCHCLFCSGQLSAALDEPPVPPHKPIRSCCRWLQGKGVRLGRTNQEVFRVQQIQVSLHFRRLRPAHRTVGPPRHQWDPSQRTRPLRLRLRRPADLRLRRRRRRGGLRHAPPAPP